MSLINYEFTCANGHVFTAPGVASVSYGEFVVRGEISPLPGLLDTFQDATFDEVSDILNTLDDYRNRAESERASILHEVFGVTCDLAQDGTRLKVGRLAPCPICGSRRMKSRVPVGKYDGSTISITHEGWSQLSNPEKMLLLKHSLDEIGGGP